MDDIPPLTSGAPPNGAAAPASSRERYVPRIGLLLVVLVGILGTGAYLGVRVIGALPDVGKDLHPTVPWGAPIALERRSNGWLIAHVPPCAQGPVAGLFLWDDHDRPLWELRGQAFPISDFLVGTTPAGLQVVHPFEQPSRDQELRLGVFRAAGQPAGITFRVRDLRNGRVHYGGKWITATQFKLSAKCPKPKVLAKQARSTTTSTGP